MKKFFRNQKGINLISLTITVLVILVLTNVVIYNVKSNLKTQNIKSLQTDISNLREKISTYYSKYGEIPVNKEYINTANINVISSAVDTGKFYVIDLSALDNITLNYGMDYEKIKSGEVTDVNTLSDLYIINKDSHNIFYVEGVTSNFSGFIPRSNPANKCPNSCIKANIITIIYVFTWPCKIKQNKKQKNF